MTSNSAKAANLMDRGEIALGKRADLIAVKHNNDFPQVTKTWVDGRIIYQCNYLK